MFRPFPAEMLRPVLAGRKAIGVLDRSASFGGWGGPVFNEVRSALYGTANPVPVLNWIYGLGGRDFELGHAAEVIEALRKIAAGQELPHPQPARLPGVRRRLTMAVNLKQLAQNEDLLTGGHRACAGCMGPNILRQVMLTAGKDTVMGGATGCMEVVTTIYPYTAWKTSFIHSAFENSAATVSGVETAYRALKKRASCPRRRRPTRT